MQLTEFNLIRLESDTYIPPFDCGNDDLNNFLFDDAKNFRKQLLAVTFLIITNDGKELVAYFNYLNDKITHTDLGNREKFIDRVSSLLPNGKNEFVSFPAVKIGRLAVATKYKGNGLGRQILDYTKGLFVDMNRTGCKFITVDAYRESLEFYQKNDFIYLSSKDKKSDTRLMYYNLGALS